jgi:hypothetical protein
MKKQILSTILASTLGLLSTNAFTATLTCNNTDMKEAIRNVDKAILRKTIQLRFNENDIQDMADLNASAQKVHRTSVALLSASGLLIVGAAGASLFAASTPFEYAISDALTMGSASYSYSVGGALGVLIGIRSDSHAPELRAVKRFTKSVITELNDKKENQESPLKTKFGFQVKQSTDAFLADFITANDQKLDEKSEELLAANRNAGNGALGGQGATYTSALLSVVEARKELYTFQLSTLQKIKIEIATSCSELEER